MDENQNGEPEQLEEQANAADEGGVVDPAEGAQSDAIPEEVVNPPLSEEQIEAAQADDAREAGEDQSDPAPAATPDEAAPAPAEGE